MNKTSAKNNSTELAIKELRKFGRTISFCFLALALVMLFLEKDRYIYFAEIGGILLILSIFVPGWLSPVRHAWFMIGEAIGFVVTHVILAVLFYFVVTPIGVLGKIFGKRFLGPGFSHERRSFWDTNKKTAPTRKENWEKQF